MYHKCRKEYFLLLIFLVIEVNNANIIEPIKLKVNKPDLIATPEDEPIELSENTRKMLDGEFYDPLTPELLNGRAFAKLMCQKINEESPLNISSRIDLLKELFGSFKTGCFIEPPFYCDYGSNIYLGENVYMNHDCILLDVAPIIIGKNVFIGPSVQIYTATHPVDPILRRTGEYGKTVIIENDVWIGGAAIILPGIKIGKGSTIGAGSVVTKDVEPFVVVAGNPAKVIRKLQVQNLDV